MCNKEDLQLMKYLVNKIFKKGEYFKKQAMGPVKPIIDLTKKEGISFSKIKI